MFETLPMPMLYEVELSARFPHWNATATNRTLLSQMHLSVHYTLLLFPYQLLALHCYPRRVFAPWPAYCDELLTDLTRNITRDGILNQRTIFFDSESTSPPPEQPSQSLPLTFGRERYCQMVVDFRERTSISRRSTLSTWKRILRAATIVNSYCVRDLNRAGKDYVVSSLRMKVKLVSVDAMRLCCSQNDKV